jgi:hypothetical protein
METMVVVTRKKERERKYLANNNNIRNLFLSFMSTSLSHLIKYSMGTKEF